MKNTIAERVADFLKGFPPFDLLTKSELEKVSSDVSILYFEKDALIFDVNDTAHEYFYLVHKGAIALQVKDEDFSTIDECDEGDIFGLRPLIAKENKYVIKSTAIEESIIYGIPIAIFRPIIENNFQIGIFLIESFASNTKNPFSKEFGSAIYSTPSSVNSDPELFELQPASFIKNVIQCNKNDLVSEVAKLMSERKIGSVLITKGGVPIGIITDHDIREKIATGIYPINSPASQIMTSPVICYKKGITIAQAQAAMLKHHISYLCLTKDGTPNSKVTGIISEHDIIVSKGNNPAVLMKAINRSVKVKQLRRIREKVMILLRGYIDQNIPLTHISKIIYELNDATIKRIITLSLNKIETAPPVKFSWLSVGSQGRKEQLLHTDQDNAIVFENVPEDQLDETKAYFLQLATIATNYLNRIGYDFCPAEMMANNPRWCLSLSEWKSQFTHWITEAGEDEILLCSIFFDYDISYGNIDLVNKLSDHIFSITDRNQLFFSILGRSTLASPSPLGFFRQLLVEQDGEHKDFFDLKKRAIMPLTDAGRLLILSHKVKHINNTAERFEKLATLEPKNTELYLSCSYASKALLKFRTKQGLLHNDSGRYLALKSLTKEEKIKLKRCFKTLRDIQELIKLRFRLTQFL